MCVRAPSTSISRGFSNYLAAKLTSDGWDVIQVWERTNPDNWLHFGGEVPKDDLRGAGATWNAVDKFFLSMEDTKTAQAQTLTNRCALDVTDGPTYIYVIFYLEPVSDTV